MKILFMFLKEVSYAHQGCIDLIKNTLKWQYCGIVLQFRQTVLYFKIEFIHVMAKLKFQSVLSVRNDADNMQTWC